MRFGALDSKIKQLLEDYEAELQNNKALPVGAEIVKKFNGQVYKLRIVEGGYELNGEFHKSLSGAALAITGRKIYGQAFWGL